MLKELLLGLSFVLAVSCSVIDSNFAQTPQCLEANGFCVAKSECDQSEDKQYNALCQHGNKESICCKDFPQTKIRCSALHNSCKKKGDCKGALDLGKRECKDGHTCCLLV